MGSSFPNARGKKGGGLRGHASRWAGPATTKVMSSSTFVPSEYAWLKLRFPFDARSRSSALAARFAEHLRARSRVSVLDLGAGFGANTLWLESRLPPPQHWTLVDRDPALISRVTHSLAHASELVGETLGGSLACRREEGTFEVECVHADMFSPHPSLARRFDACTANAVFDLNTAEQMDALCVRLGEWLEPGSPAYFTLHLNEELRLGPEVEGDARFLAGFHRHMQRPQAFGCATGPDSCRVLISALRTHGWTVETESSPWVVQADEGAFLHANVDFMASAIEELLPESERADAARWVTSKRKAIDAGAGSLRVGHCDVLAWAP